MDNAKVRRDLVKEKLNYFKRIKTKEEI